VNESPAADERRPFKAVLDVGLTRTTVGNRVFSILKGATDGGLYVPHSVTRFPGQVSVEVKGETSIEYKPEIHRQRRFGAHIDNYMKELKKSNPESFKRQFGKLAACLTANKVDSLEKLYTSLHDKIRANPDRVKNAEKKNPNRDHAKR
jgi:large subunit ribosomal protein L5e